jgi:scyllo-inositol 2-dehydrogenase (NADP+)
MVTLTFADGATAVFDVGAMSRVPKPRVYAVGSAATFVKYGVDPQEAAMIAGDIDVAREDEGNYAHVHDGQRETVLQPVPGRWRGYYENVADVLTRGAAPAVKLEEMRRLMAALDAIFESARTGAVVRPAVQ